MSLKKLKTGLIKNKTAILIILVFAVNSITASWLDILRLKDPATCVEWHDQKVILSTAQSFFEYVPYLLIGLMAWKRFDLDNFDAVMLGICIISCIVTSNDFYQNDNERSTWLDWRVFGIAFILILAIKLSWNRLLKIISRILRLS